MTQRPQVYRLSFYTSYHQFYVEDCDAEVDTSLPSFWSDDAIRRGMAVGDGVLGIDTISYGSIRCFFEISNSEPQLSFDPWQRIVEASLHITKGRYAVLNCPDATILLEGTCRPGDYRLRVYGTFLDRQVEDSIEDDYFDFYWLVLWPAPYSIPKSLKTYNRSET